MPHTTPARISVPLPGGPLTGTPAHLRAMAGYIRHELRRQVQPGAPDRIHQVQLPGGRQFIGSATILLRLAARIEAAAYPDAAPVRARVAQGPPALALHPTHPAHQTVRLEGQPGDRGTARLTDNDADPTDPDAPACVTLQTYWACVWGPDAHAPNGWTPITPEVEGREYSISRAAVRIAVAEAVELADDELLAVRWAGADAPTCFLTANQVRYARQQLELPTEERSDPNAH